MDDGNPDSDTTAYFKHFTEFKLRIRKVFRIINDEYIAVQVIYTIK
jgi:hypothetical protein